MFGLGFGELAMGALCVLATHGLAFVAGVAIERMRALKHEAVLLRERLRPAGEV